MIADRCPGATADEAADTWSVAALAGKVDLTVGESTLVIQPVEG